MMFLVASAVLVRLAVCRGEDPAALAQKQKELLGTAKVLSDEARSLEILLARRRARKRNSASAAPTLLSGAKVAALTPGQVLLARSRGEDMLHRAERHDGAFLYSSNRPLRNRSWRRILSATDPLATATASAVAPAPVPLKTMPQHRIVLAADLPATTTTPGASPAPVAQATPTDQASSSTGAVGSLKAWIPDISQVTAVVALFHVMWPAFCIGLLLVICFCCCCGFMAYYSLQKSAPTRMSGHSEGPENTAQHRRASQSFQEYQTGLTDSLASGGTGKQQDIRTDESGD